MYLLLSLSITIMVESRTLFFITICAASDSGGMENLYEGEINLTEDSKQLLAVVAGIFIFNIIKFSPQPYWSIFVISLSLSVVIWSIFGGKQVKRPFRFLIFLLLFPVLILGLAKLIYYFYPNLLGDMDLMGVFVVVYGIILFICLPLIMIKYGNEKQKRIAKISGLIMWGVLIVNTIIIMK